MSHINPTSPEAGTSPGFDRRLRHYLSPEPMLQEPEWLLDEAGAGFTTPSYAYARNNPLRYTDPTGRWAVEGPGGPILPIIIALKAGEVVANIIVPDPPPKPVYSDEFPQQGPVRIRKLLYAPDGPSCAAARRRNPTGADREQQCIARCDTPDELREFCEGLPTATPRQRAIYFECLRAAELAEVGLVEECKNQCRSAFNWGHRPAGPARR